MKIQIQCESCGDWINENEIYAEINTGWELDSRKINKDSKFWCIKCEGEDE